MEGSQFDRMTKRLAQPRLSRRGTLKRGGLGLAAALAGIGLSTQRRGTLLAQSTPAASPAAENPNAVEIDGAWFCNQTFALCTTAPCDRSASNPTIANCHCIVEHSYAIGFKSCAERAQSGLKLVSNFSTVNVNSAFSVMTCPADAPWANCLDMPCEIDPRNPAVATCQCQMVESGPSLTFGGGCDASTCTTTSWSAAPTDYLGMAQYEKGMQQANQTVTIPPTCPAATPAAAAASTPASA